MKRRLFPILSVLSLLLSVAVGLCVSGAGCASGQDSTRAYANLAPADRAIAIARDDFIRRAEPPDYVELELKAEPFRDGWKVRVLQVINQDGLIGFVPATTMIIIGPDWKVKEWWPGA